LRKDNNMKTLVVDPALSAELQELYLENKEWSSNICFLEEDMHFIQNLFNKVISEKAKNGSLQKVSTVITNVNLLINRRKQLKLVLTKRTFKLEQLLEGNTGTIELQFIEEDSAIIKEIKSLLVAQRLLKEEFLALLKLQKHQEKPIFEKSHFKRPRYPIY
jgi:hypothetical protein